MIYKQYMSSIMPKKYTSVPHGPIVPSDLEGHPILSIMDYTKQNNRAIRAIKNASGSYTLDNGMVISQESYDWLTKMGFIEKPFNPKMAENMGSSSAPAARKFMLSTPDNSLSQNAYTGFSINDMRTESPSPIMRKFHNYMTQQQPRTAGQF